MQEILIDGNKFIKFSNGKSEFIFSTAENGLSFNKSLSSEMENLNNIKKWFNVQEVGFLNQIHSDNVFHYNKQVLDGDALITDVKNIAIGVFTADCVPVLIYDKSNGISAAVHSGWKGTLDCIVMKTIEKMKKTYKTKQEDLIVYIGPHNRQCCYEVGEEVIEKFTSSDFYKDQPLFEGRNLSMIKCIKHQLNKCGVLIENIEDLNICTFCGNEYKMHSYRKNKNGGRMFSFVIVR